MSALPLKVFYQGDTATLDFTLLEPNGSKLDLDTVSEITWTMSDPAEIDTPLLEKTTASGVAVLDPDKGLCRVTIPAGELDTPGQYVHEIEASFAGGQTYTYGQGPMVVKATVTPS
jgi:hypothetical protein